MSAILGIVRHDNSTGDLALPPVLGRMSQAMAHRGPHGSGAWHGEDAGVALGHLALHATPEAEHESLPLRHAARDLAVTADVRLDNRAELLAELRSEIEQVLGARGVPDERVGDGALILAAYEKWGDECAKYLLGDFAFAIWDGEGERLFCGRDHAGVKPFYFHHDESSGQFAFASEIKALFEVPGVTREIDEVRAAEYLMYMFSSHENTAFADIKRLPPAHTLSASRDGVEVRRYWDLRDTPMLPPMKSAEYEKRFREILFEAVRCRLRAPRVPNAVAGFLSGGLDSTSVMCAARDIRRQEQETEDLPALCVVFDEVKECDERAYMKPALAMGGLRAHWIRGEDRSSLQDLETVVWHRDEPILGPNFCSAWTHYKPAQAMGARVILDGHGGDETVGYGLARLNELAEAGRWRVLWRELRALERNGFLDNGPGAVSLLRTFAWSRAGLARRVASAIARRLPRRKSAGAAPAKPDWQRLVSDEFAARVGAAAVRREGAALIPRRGEGERVLSEKTLASPLQALAFEELDHAAAAAGLEARYPLWDKRLVEFCLGLPSGQKLKSGWTRSILRRALKGVLPREVQWRAGKNDFTAEAWRGLQTRDRHRLEAVVRDGLPRSTPYIDIETATRCVQEVLKGGEPVNSVSQFAVRATSFEEWLRQTQSGGTKDECVVANEAISK